MASDIGLEDDPLWYKDAVIYELHVRTFYDSDGDGLGDFRGLIEKLDYLQDLGVTALWLLPFYPSPWRDDGYDIADYTAIHPAYGTRRDFKRFLREAHARGMRVITEMVINHTSDQHPWFQRARHAKPTSRYRDYYVWSDTPEAYPEARVIFQDFESSNWTWDSAAGAYYWHRFYSQQPDLNYENEQVHKAITRAMDFWFRMGVNGMRLDAVPYLYEREGTDCENLPETHAFLKQLRAHVDERFDNRMLLAEANQWPEEAVSYFGDGDECHMAFHFPIMPRLFMALRMEDRFPIIEIMDQTPAIPDTAQWAFFLRNHDELTLEMVTDEERDYMYRVYAHDAEARINLGIRRRLAPLLGNNRRKIELMNGLLFSLPGTPVLYYGDEIGMGDNFFLGDRNGVRTPMQWSGDRNAGFSDANPQRLHLPVVIDPEYHYETVNVEAQHGNPSSLLWWMRRMITMRKRHKALSRGSIEFLYPQNPKVLAFIRRYGDQRILATFNLSRFVQPVTLDLSTFRGVVPVELSGQTRFPPIGDAPYFLTLGPHAFYWFLLKEARAAERIPELAPAPEERLVVSGEWQTVFRGRSREGVERALRRHLRDRRWFAGKAKRIRSVRVRDVLPLRSADADVAVVLADVAYIEGDTETYVVPATFSTGAAAERVEHRAARSVITPLGAGDREGLLHDALASPDGARALLDAVVRRRRVGGERGRLRAMTMPELRSIVRNGGDGLEPHPLAVEQSNTSVAYGDELILKLLRRTEPGVNPDLEIGRFLTERGFDHTPALLGSLQYSEGRGRYDRGELMTLAVLHRCVPNEGDAWRYTRDALSRYFEQVLASELEPPAVTASTAGLLDRAARQVPELADDLFGTYLESAARMGRRTAQLHGVLASEPEDPAFSPVPFTRHYQRSVYQSMRSLALQTFRTLEPRATQLPDRARREVTQLLAAQDELLGRFRAILDRRLDALRIRIHGDYHLGQVLYTGKDFLIIDFEGEPARPISTRRIKRSTLRDVAGMLRSFHYAACSAFSDLEARGLADPADTSALEPWTVYWYAWVSAVFLRSYLDAMDATGVLPESREGLEAMLDVYLLDKAVYELGYELSHRPDWVTIPVHGIGLLLHR